MGLNSIFTFWRGVKNKPTADLDLRPLGRLEKVLPIKKLPNNIYGFVISSPLVQEIRKNHPGNLKLKRKRKPYWCFEVQKINNDVMVLGYINHHSFDQLYTASAEQPLVIRLFPIPWEHMPHLVGVLLTHIKAIKEECVTSDHEEIEILDIKISAVTVNVWAH